jgi:hypothetical protein
LAHGLRSTYGWRGEGSKASDQGDRDDALQDTSYQRVLIRQVADRKVESARILPKDICQGSVPWPNKHAFVSPQLA